VCCFAACLLGCQAASSVDAALDVRHPNTGILGRAKGQKPSDNCFQLSTKSSVLRWRDLVLRQPWSMTPLPERVKHLPPSRSMDLASSADEYEATPCRISRIPFQLVVRPSISATYGTALCYCDSTRQYVAMRPSWRAPTTARRSFKSSLLLTLQPPKLSRSGPEQAAEMTG
jgi:hypothetical protein